MFRILCDNTFQVKDTRVLVATGQPNMLEQLQESNVLLDDIQKGLNTYLEKKRLYFPRALSVALQIFDISAILTPICRLKYTLTVYVC